MDTGTIYRGQKCRLISGPKRPCVASFTCLNCGGKNWFSVPLPALIAGPDVCCWQCGGVCNVRAEPDSAMSEALSEMQDLMMKIAALEARKLPPAAAAAWRRSLEA
jgi:hypothetical protein